MPATALYTHNRREEVSEAEWCTRVDLAAAYRLVALFGWDDLVFTHISARVPGREGEFLINPYGFMFEEITASCLVKVDAVSYTHLRAHETVLDLVCRLLLEKKHAQRKHNQLMYKHSRSI